MDVLSRRGFLAASALGAMATAADSPPVAQTAPSIGTLILNDDGHVFPYLSDDLHAGDLWRYLKSYCRPGVNTVAFCVGDMSWPTLHETKVGVHYHAVPPGDDMKRARMYRNVDNLASEPGGYFGATFRMLHELGKTALASFRMNDAHFTTTDNPNVSEFWKQHADFALGSAYGYYGGCLNYESEVVRNHFYDRVVEFAERYPEVDGIELDAMRSPFFFPPDKGAEDAPLFTELIRRIKSALSEQAKRLGRPDYRLTINVPLTPELALQCGLDVAAWDAERLVDCVSAGTYQVYMDSPLEKWKARLVNGTPVFAYVNCSPQTGRYLGLEEYRAAAANAYGSGADGVYLFNYPCLFELATQVPSDAAKPPMQLGDMRFQGQRDFSTVAKALDEIGNKNALKRKDKRYLYYFSNDKSYRHYAPTLEGLSRASAPGPLTATFRCYDDYNAARTVTLTFKIENVARTERFDLSVNGNPIAPEQQVLRYAANGRDTRIHSVSLGPYLEYEIALRPDQLVAGENRLEVAAARLEPDLTPTINLTEVELFVAYGRA